MALSENDPAAVGPLPSGAAQPASPPDSVPSVAHRPSSSATGADFASFYGPLLSGAAQPAEEAHIADILLTPHLPAAPVAALPDFSGEMLRHIPCAILNYLGCFSLDWYAFVAACKMASQKSAGTRRLRASWYFCKMAQSAEDKAGLTVECGHSEAEQAELAKLASELAAEKARVVQLEEKVAKLNADVERVSQGAEAARIALATAESQAALECQAELALASGMRFIDSLRALLGRPAPAPSQGPEPEPRQLCQPCQRPDGGAKLPDGLPTGPLHSGAPGALGRATKEKFPGVSLVECSAAAGGGRIRRNWQATEQPLQTSCVLRNWTARNRRWFSVSSAD